MSEEEEEDFRGPLGQQLHPQLLTGLNRGAAWSMLWSRVKKDGFESGA